MHEKTKDVCEGASDDAKQNTRGLASEASGGVDGAKDGKATTGHHDASNKVCKLAVLDPITKADQALSISRLSRPQSPGSHQTLQLCTCTQFTRGDSHEPFSQSMRVPVLCRRMLEASH